MRLEAGAYAFRQGDPTDGFFAVRSGTVEMRRTTADGNPVVLHRAGKGETFAEASLFSEHYHCDAIAITSCELVRLPRSIALAQFQAGGEAALAFAADLASQVQRYRLLLQLCAIRRADERVLAALRAGFRPQSWKSFAPQIALSHEAVYRALSSLTVRGIVERTGRGTYRLCEGSEKTRP